MVRWFCLVLCAVAACGRGSADAQGSGSGVDAIAQEQARFDAERQPKTIVDAMAITPGARVADIGAGSGLLTVHLARAVAPNGHVVATDVDRGALELLTQRLTAMHLADLVEPREVPADTPGLEAASYDAILLAEVDHLLPEPVAWLRSASGALKHGGRIVISNRIYHRAQALANAKKAGLVLMSDTEPVPSHFIAVFVAGEPK